MRPGIFFSPRRRKGRVAPVSPSFKKHPTNSPPCQTDSAMRRKGQPLPQDSRNASAPGRPALRNVRRGQPQLPFALMRCREENIARPKSKLRPNGACWAIRTGPPARTFLASLTLARSFA